MGGLECGEDVADLRQRDDAFQLKSSRNIRPNTIFRMFKTVVGT